MSDVIGNIPLGSSPTSEPEVKDGLDLARSVWKKGRHGYMGGPVYFTQDGRNNNNRTCNYAYPTGLKVDPMAHDLGVDETEN